MTKTKRSIEIALGTLESKIEILKNFFYDYQNDQKIRVTHHSDSENFAQSFILSEKKKSKIFFKAFQRQVQDLEKDYSDNKIDKIIEWIKTEGVLDLEKEKQLIKIYDAKLKSGKNFMVNVLATDILKEFSYKAGLIDIEKYNTALLFMKKIKDMYIFHHKIGYIEDEKN